jgi:hypothetical protein
MRSKPLPTRRSNPANASPRKLFKMRHISNVPPSDRFYRLIQSLSLIGSASRADQMLAANVPMVPFRPFGTRPQPFTSTSHGQLPASSESVKAQGRRAITGLSLFLVWRQGWCFFRSHLWITRIGSDVGGSAELPSAEPNTTRPTASNMQCPSGTRTALQHRT